MDHRQFHRHVGTPYLRLGGRPSRAWDGMSFAAGVIHHPACPSACQTVRDVAFGSAVSEINEAQQRGKRHMDLCPGSVLLRSASDGGRLPSDLVNLPFFRGAEEWRHVLRRARFGFP